jgi:hypothetical protein
MYIHIIVLTFTVVISEHNGLMRNNVKSKVIPAINSTPYNEEGRSQDSAFGVATGFGLDCRGNGVCIPAG